MGHILWHVHKHEQLFAWSTWSRMVECVAFVCDLSKLDRLGLAFVRIWWILSTHSNEQWGCQRAFYIPLLWSTSETDKVTVSIPDMLQCYCYSAKLITRTICFQLFTWCNMICVVIKSIYDKCYHRNTSWQISLETTCRLRSMTDRISNGLRIWIKERVMVTRLSFDDDWRIVHDDNQGDWLWYMYFT